MSDDPGRGVLVSPRVLAEHLGDRDVRVVDIRGKVLPPGSEPRYRPSREEYLAAHVPGAVFVDWTRDIVDLGDPVPVQVAQAEAFAARMTALGVGPGTLVVAYDDHDHIFAGRLAWALRYYGHDAVRILGGGWPAWVAAGLPTEAGEAVSPSPASPPFVARPRPELRRTAAQVAARLGDPDVLIIDARPADQFEGRASAARRSGHIPGARNVPYASLVDRTTGQFLPPDDLAKVFAGAGVDVARLPREVVVYCNGGVSCTVPQNALALLGRADAAVYDGSWNEWGNDDARPLESGPAKVPSGA